MSEIKDLLASLYIKELDTGYVGKIESITTPSVVDSIAVSGNGTVRAAFVTNDGNIIKKSLHSSKVKTIDEEEFEEVLETIMTILRAKERKINKFCYGSHEEDIE